MQWFLIKLQSLFLMISVERKYRVNSLINKTLTQNSATHRRKKSALADIRLLLTMIGQSKWEKRTYEIDLYNVILINLKLIR